MFEKIKSINVRSVLKYILTLIGANKALFLAVFGYIIALSTFTILRQAAFLTSGFDLGIFNQAFSTTLHQHKLFYETGDLSFNPNGSFFGVHFSPILLLLLPLYTIWPTPENLLIMQTTILALGAIPLYWIASSKLGKNVGLLTVLIYLCNPLVLSVNFNDFHLEAFTSTFFLFSLYYLDKERWKGFSVFMILAFSTIEFAPIIGIFVALYAFILHLKGKFANPKRALKYIAVIAVISIVWFILSLEVKGFFNPSTSPVPSPFHNILQSPAGLLNVIGTDLGSKMFYVTILFAPLAFLPILAPEALIMLIPWMGASFLSIYPAYYSVYYQYQGFVIPFMFFALVKSIERLNFKKTKRIFGVLFITTFIISLFIFSSPQTPYKLPVPNERLQMLDNILPFIPSSASILTENDLFPHISDRTDAYMYLPQDSNISIDYILVDVGSFWYTWQQPNAFGDRSAPQIYTEEVLKDGSFGVYASAGTIILLKRGYSGEPVLFTPFNSKYDYGSLIRDSGSTIHDSTSSSKNVFFHNETNPAGSLWHGPYVDLPPGLYNVTYALKVNDASSLNPSDQLLTVDVTAASGTVMISNNQIYGLSVPAGDEWFNVTFGFGLSLPTRGVEFRGFVDGAYNISFDYVALKQISPQPINSTDNSFNGS